MDTYYKPEDLPKFEEIGKEAQELARKFFDYYGAVFAEGELTEREKALNGLGYGREGTELELNLVSNPTGAFLRGDGVSSSTNSTISPTCPWGDSGSGSQSPGTLKPMLIDFLPISIPARSRGSCAGPLSLSPGRASSTIVISTWREGSTLETGESMSRRCKVRRSRAAPLPWQTIATAARPVPDSHEGERSRPEFRPSL